MIVEALAVSALVAKTMHSVNKATKMDEKALRKYAKAFELKEEADQLIRNKSEYVDKRLANVAKKKRAIIASTIPKFAEIYGKIQKVELGHYGNTDGSLAMKSNAFMIENRLVPMSYKKEFSDKELVCGLLIKGVGKMIEKDSERYLSAANNQLRAANVVRAQAESITTVYDAIISRADRIAKILMSMNALFIKSIQETSETIDRNGLDVKKYSEYDKGVLMTCVNIAIAMTDIIDIPVVDDNGTLCKAAEEMITKGEQYIIKIEKAINN